LDSVEKKYGEARGQALSAPGDLSQALGELPFLDEEEVIRIRLDQFHC